MDFKDIVAYLFIVLGIAGVAWFAWVSRKGQKSQDASTDDPTRK